MNFLVHHLLLSSAERFPNHEALVQGSFRLGYETLSRQVKSLARALQAAGLARGDRVGVLLDPSPAQATALLGVSAANAVFVPIHHGLFAEQIEHIVRDCDMRGLIVDAARFAKYQETIQSCTSLEFVVIVGSATTETTIRQYDFASLLVGDDHPSELAIDRDLAAILYTSGSTGKPKGVMLSHANLVAGARIVADYLHIGHSDRTLAVLPFSFDAGLNQLMTALHSGATCLPFRFLFAKEIVAALAKEKVTGLAGVPSLWNLLSQDNSKLSDTPLEHLRYITNTGGALPQSVLSRLRAALPQTDVVLMYGLTEAFRSTYLPPAELDRRPTSMGKAIPNTEIYVVNDQGQRCQPGEIGELVHRGPTVSLGYWGHPGLTAQVLRPDPFAPPQISQPELVCYSGDLVKTDEEGFLYFVGRRDNQIKSAGFRISPTEVELALCRVDQVRESAVIGLPDELLGEHIKAFVVPQAGNTVDVDTLLEEAAIHLPRHMVPRVVEIVEELPRTSSGKVDYPQLRRRSQASPR